ncbi:MAG TPA: trypsin-like peptidase domain-containing protein [Actinomycetes bacterium]|nr:trypsin-like peptidase domain-containing protein [Actinomycetes bacterium]
MTDRTNGDDSTDPPAWWTPRYDSPQASADVPHRAEPDRVEPDWAEPDRVDERTWDWEVAESSPPPRRRGGVAAAVVTATVVALLIGAAAGGLAGYYVADRENNRVHDSGVRLDTPPARTLERAPDSIAGIADAVLPSVVKIEVSGAGQEGTGSGFVIRDDGYILTNNHVVAPAAEGGRLQVRFGDARPVVASIVGRDPRTDLAVIKVVEGGLNAVALGNSDGVVVGDPVVAIGSPLGLAGTVTSGIVSAKNRTVIAGEAESEQSAFISAIQTDAAINPGNSGGPLVDSRGQVIGVNSAIATLGEGIGGEQPGSIGLGFAIPINDARRIAEQLIADGRADHAAIGVDLDLGFEDGGARIADEGSEPIAAGGPAEQAGLRPGDVIVKVDDRVITSPGDLIVELGTHSPGDTVTVTYLRGGDQQPPVQVTLASYDRLNG